MILKSRIRILAGAALVALTVAGMALTAGGAEARDDAYDRNCAAPGASLIPPSSLDWEFFPPNELVNMYDAAGMRHTMQCGPYGVWKDVSRVESSPEPWHGGVRVTNFPNGRIRRR